MLRLARSTPRFFRCISTTVRAYDPCFYSASQWLDDDSETLPFVGLVNVFSVVERTRARSAKTATLAALFRTIAAKPEPVRHVLMPSVAQLALGDFAPVYEGQTLGMGQATLNAAVAAAANVPVSDVAAAVRKHGDLGRAGAVLVPLVAGLEASPSRPRLSTDEVLQRLQSIASDHGTLAVSRRQDAVVDLLHACHTADEVVFALRLLEGRGLRVGLALRSVLAALVHGTTPLPVPSPASSSSSATPPTLSDVTAALDSVCHAGTTTTTTTTASHSDTSSDDFTTALSVLSAAACAPTADINEAQLLFSTHPSLPAFACALTDGGLPAARVACRLQHGVPALAMLGVAASGADAVAAAFTNQRPFSCEHKYDGERVQVHWARHGGAFAFSRNGENVSERFADVVSLAAAAAGDDVQSFVLEGEVVAVDRKKGHILPFQVLAARPTTDVDVALFAFDLLHLNSVAVHDQPFHTRRSMLHDAFQPTPDLRFRFAGGEDVADDGTMTEPDVAAIVAAATAAAVEQQCEGLMVKPHASLYRPGTRTKTWLKLKMDYDGMVGGDTLDVVPIAAWWGRGKRTGTLGAFLVACFDPDSGRFTALTKVGTGFSDADLKAFTTAFQPAAVPVVDGEAPPLGVDVAPTVKPDVWLPPGHVWEIRSTQFTQSPTSRTATGISVRFPRFVRRRPDKVPTQATTGADVLRMAGNLEEHTRTPPSHPTPAGEPKDTQN